MKKFFLISTTFFLIISCKSEIEKDIIGFWEIEQAYYNNEQVANDLHTNIINFKNNSTCSLPTSLGESRTGMSGDYTVTIESDSIFILISTPNKIFNRNFYISKFDKQVDERTGYKFIEMTIEADSLMLDLVRKWDVK